VLTPGVVLERIGDRDVLRAADGGPVPRRLRIAFTPKSENLEADYSILVFTDGSTALPSGQFDVFPVDSPAAVAELPRDLNGHEMEGGAATVTWRDRAGPILFRGRRVAEATEAEAETYVLFGEADLVEGERLITVADPALPAWIGDAIETFAPRVADLYAERLGPGQSARPTIMMSWDGPTDGMTSMGGSVMPGLIVMAFEGEGVVQPTAAVLAMSRWFIGHESAHFWLGQVVRYERARDAWITEGGADMMAIRAMQRIDPDWDARAELQKEVDDCVARADEPVAEAAGRGEHRATYACGAVFAMIAEAAQRRATGGDWFDFLKPLIDASRADGVLTRDEWLDALDAVSGDQETRRDIEALLDQGAPDAAAVVARLFDRSGVAYGLEDGRVVLG
ncbi:MAG: M1 family aminopeptidase, partial [Brevundimonas sp.]